MMMKRGNKLHHLGLVYSVRNSNYLILLWHIVNMKYCIIIIIIIINNTLILQQYNPIQSAQNNHVCVQKKNHQHHGGIATHNTKECTSACKQDTPILMDTLSLFFWQQRALGPCGKVNIHCSCLDNPWMCLMRDGWEEGSQ